MLLHQCKLYVLPLLLLFALSLVYDRQRHLFDSDFTLPKLLSSLPTLNHHSSFDLYVFREGSCDVCCTSRTVISNCAMPPCGPIQALCQYETAILRKAATPFSFGWVWGSSDQLSKDNVLLNPLAKICPQFFVQYLEKSPFLSPKMERGYELSQEQGGPANYEYLFGVIYCKCKILQCTSIINNNL